MTHGKNRPIHLLHVVPGLPPGGMELTMGRVITGLRPSGMRHTIASLKGDNHIVGHYPDDTEVHSFHSRPNAPELPAQLARLIRRIRPTVIHARNWGAWPDTAVARLMAWPIVPMIFSFHGFGRAGFMPLRRRLASRVLVRMTTQLLALSEVSKQMLVARWGWPEHRVDVIPNGVDTERFRPTRGRRGTGRIVIGSVGNLRPVKNHALLIRACVELAGGGTDLEVRIAGEGPERPSLAALAESLGFSDRLSLPGRVADVPGFLNGLDVFVLSSDSEQHPNALNEAMACGVPSIATRVGCVEELLDDGRCGRIIPPGDLPALVAALRERIDDPVTGGTLADAARRRACERYSNETMLAAYDRMYRRLSACLSGRQAGEGGTA